MHFASLAVILLGVTFAYGGPLKHKRQDDSGSSPTTTSVEQGGNGGGDTPTSAPDAGNTGRSSTTTTTTAEDSTSSSPSSGDNDCSPCTGTTSYNTYTSPTGRRCYCLEGSSDPWSWTDAGRCINDSVGLPNDEGRPYYCLGSGGVPATRACLSNCNFMLNTVNSVNPCNPNLYNAANSCAGCVSGGAIHYQLDGKSPSGPYIQDQSSMNTFLGGLKDWCAKPDRCLDLSTGAKISGNGCPQLNVDNPSVSRPGGSSPVVNTKGGGSGTTVPAKIVTSVPITTTGADGRPTLSMELMTIDNPAFTANTEFATARATGTDGGNGAAVASTRVSFVSVLLGFAVMVAMV